MFLWTLPLDPKFPPSRLKAHSRARQDGLPRSHRLGTVHFSGPTRNHLWVNCLSSSPSDFDYFSNTLGFLLQLFYFFLRGEKKKKLFYLVSEITTCYSFFSKWLKLSRKQSESHISTCDSLRSTQLSLLEAGSSFLLPCRLCPPGHHLIRTWGGGEVWLL